MSLADELLADLEEAAEEEEENFAEEEDEPAIEEVQEETQLDAAADSVKSIAKLWDSRTVRGGQRPETGRGSPETEGDPPGVTAGGPKHPRTRPLWDCFLSSLRK